MPTPAQRVFGGVAAAPFAAAVAGCGLVGPDMEYTAYSDDHFTIEAPEAWEPEEVEPGDGDDEEDEGTEEDGSQGQGHTVRFNHPNGDYAIEVFYWSDELLSASSNARWLEEETLATVDDPDHATSAYERIEIRREDPDDYPDDWDVAFFERTLTNDSWTTPERHMVSRTVSIDGQENYSIAFNIPVEAADDYSGVWEHVFDSFEPR
ncbi:hypothetical protein [Nocardiopsis nanhaiensis]